MATSFPTYPATTFEQAVELAIFSSNQLHNIINADPLSTVETEDGDIPSVRKALIDNLYFKTPAITWAEGTSVTVFNQLYQFSGGTTGTALWYAPTATTANPIVMGSSPEDDGNWKLYGWDTYSKTELSAKTGASLIGTSTGRTLQDDLDNIGTYLSSTVSIFQETIAYTSFLSRGFYSPDDGGSGVWVSTGNTDATKSSTHIPASALIYDANGREYKLSITGKKINANCNGLKAYTLAEVVADVASADTVCAGEVINGITSLITASFVWEGMAGVSIEVPPNVYRISKSHIKAVDSVNYYFEQSWFYVYAANEYKYSVTGKRLNGFGHTKEDIVATYEVSGSTGEDWGLVSARNIDVYGGHFYGDQTLDKTMDNYTSGCGIIVLNPEYVNFHSTTAQNFIWPCVVTKAEAVATPWAADGDFDVDGKDYDYIIPFMSTAGTRWGNFYGANFDNCRFFSGVRGSFRSNVDWSRFDGGIITTAWVLSGTGNNPSGQVPSYFAAITGTGFHCSGAYVSSNGGIGAYNSNPTKGIVFTSAKGHVFSGLYTEWTIRNFVIDKYTYANSSTSRSMGLHIDSVSQYKENPGTMGLIGFQEGCFGYYNSEGVWVSADDFNGSTTTPQGTTEIAVGSPVRDMGAFHHGGYNFKYGPYNVINDGDNPDIELIRDTKTAKEMFNSYGMIVKNADLIFPTKEMSQRSMVCVWIKDLTGNFDPTNFSLYLNAAQETQATNANDFLSYGELQIDYGNGYKMIMLSNRREYPNDGRESWDPQLGLRLENTSGDTPILLKAIEAYSGGFPVFPQGCDYLPSSDTSSGDIFGISPGFENTGPGGGVFFAGDLVNAWSGTKLGDDYVTRTLSDYYDPLPAIVVSGYNLPSRMQSTFSASILSIDTTAKTTTVSLPSNYTAGVCQGIPLYIVSGGTYSGEVKILQRVANSDGTLTSNYVLNGVLGVVGNTLSVDQTQLPGVSLRRDVNVNSLTAANQITSPEIVATTEINSENGYIHLGRGRSDLHTDVIGFHPTGAYDPDAEITCYKSGDTTTFTFSANANTFNGNILPTTGASYDLGASNGTWNNLYLQSAATVVSDLDKKPVVEEFTDTELAVATQCAKAYRKYKLQDAIALKGEDGARYHIGTIAQYVMQAFTDNGLDWTKYGVVTYEEWEATDAEVDENGNVLVPATEAGHIYMVRYDELNSFINAAQETRLEKLEKLFMTT